MNDDIVGSPIYIPDTDNGLRQAAKFKLESSLGDDELAEFVMVRLMNMMNECVEVGKTPLIARVVENTLEIAVFFEEVPEVIARDLPDDVDGMDIATLIGAISTIANCHTDMLVNQILCGFYDDPWELIEQSKREVN